MSNLMTTASFDSGVWVSRTPSGTNNVAAWTLVCSGVETYRYAQYLIGPGDCIEFRVKAKCTGSPGASVDICVDSLSNVVYSNPIPVSNRNSEQVMRYVAPINGSTVLVLFRVGNNGAQSNTVSTFSNPRVKIVGGSSRYSTYRVIASGMVRSTNSIAPELSSTFSNFGVSSVRAEDSTTFRVTLSHKYSNYAGTTGELRPLLFCSITGDGSPAKTATIGNFSVDGDGYAYVLIRAYELTTGNAVVISPNTSGSQSVFISFMIVAP